MSGRINHLATWIAAIVYYLFGYLWFDLLFRTQWQALSGVSMSTAPAPLMLVESFVLGLILAYATSMALTRRAGDQTVAQGISFALFMGVSIFATQTANQALYLGQPLGLWLIDTGYVIVGFAIMAAIIGGWKAKTA